MKTTRTERRTWGQRNPMTLPGVYLDSESREQNETRTKYWRRMRKWSHSVAGCGAKY